MSPAAASRPSAPPPANVSAQVFAALGHPARLAMVTRLGRDGPASISALTAGAEMTRQAVSKHLRVLADAGLVRGRRRGRESLWELEARRLAIARRFLEAVSRRWDERLESLRAAVEE
jgi:DNA-binding transcriptional ArsR family regulator